MKKILFIIFFFISFSTFAGDNLSGNYIYCVKVSENSIYVDSFEFISSYEVNTISIFNAQNHIPSNEEWENRAITFFKFKKIYETTLSNIFISWGESLSSKALSPYFKINRKTLEGFYVMLEGEPDEIFYRRGMCKIINRWSSKYKNFDLFVLDESRNFVNEAKSKNQL